MLVYIETVPEGEKGIICKIQEKVKPTRVY
jgi:hypothetical protein